MSDSGDPSDSGEEPAGGQILDREEIDSLLGADGSAGGEDEASGIERIVSAGLVAYERLPMLEIVFDRLMRILSTSLRNFTSVLIAAAARNFCWRRKAAACGRS
jgi:flagellar motor switch protein FliM